MEILIGILIGLAILICFVLLLPVRINLKNDEENNFIFKIKILFFSIPNQNSQLEKTVKERAGAKKEPKTVKKNGILETVKESKDLIIAALKELINLLHKCTVRKIYLDILCSGKDAAETAIKYGSCCSLVYPLSSFIDSLMKPKYKKQQINIRSNFETNEEHFKYEIEISVKIISLLISLIKIAWQKVKKS